jgi:hypothetical protein
MDMVRCFAHVETEIINIAGQFDDIVVQFVNIAVRFTDIANHFICDKDDL